MENITNIYDIWNYIDNYHSINYKKMRAHKKIFIKKNQVVCGIIIGELDTKDTHIHWLNADEYEHFTKINTTYL